MKNLKFLFKSSFKVIVGLLFISILLETIPASAQRHRDKVRVVGRGNRNHTKVVYSRSQRVIVRPRTIKTVTVLPTGYKTFVHNRNNYYTNNGLYYSLRNNVYVVTPPPFGIRVSVLPVGFRNIRWRNAGYYYYQGSYYNRVDATDEYEVIEPRIGMVVPELPEENVEEVNINNQIYYEFDDYLYKQIPTKDGLQYEIVGKLSDL